MLTKRLPALALLVTAALGLSACGSGGDPTPGASTSPSPSVPAGPGAANLEGVEWGEAADGTPLLTFVLPLLASESSGLVVEAGDGATIEADMIVSIDYVVFSGIDGSVTYSSYANGYPDTMMFSDGMIDPALWDVLNGARVGVRFILAGPDMSAEAVDGVTPSFVAAMTVVHASKVYERAEGQAVTPADGLPAVTLAENGAPSIDFTGAAMPSGLVVQPLITGSGAPLVEGQTLMVHYTGWLWDGEMFDSSWASGTPATFGFAQGSLIDGWVQGLAGQPVGSQVLLVIPPELGYGDVAQGSIPAGSTLVFVIDILTAF